MHLVKNAMAINLKTASRFLANDGSGKDSKENYFSLFEVGR